MKKLLLIASSLIAASGSLSAQTAGQSYPPPPERFSIKREAPSKVHPALRIESGVAQYPILAMPYSQNSNMRVDGTDDREDISYNQGVTLGFTLSCHDKSLKIPYNLGLGAMRTASPPGGGAATPSSYSRVYLFTNADLNSGLKNLSIIPGAEARRSMYRNVDSGHYVDALLVKASLRFQAAEHVQIETGAGYAPVARFGMSQSSGRSGTLADSSAKMSETFGTLTWETSPETSFLIGASQENTTVVLRDYQGYRAYGLPAVPTDVSENGTVYNLTVRQIRLGATRHF